MGTNQKTMQLLKALGVGLLALAVCFCTAVPSAETLIAYGEPEETGAIMTTSEEVKYVQAGYFATVSSASPFVNPDTNRLMTLIPGLFGCSTPGTWIDLMQYGVSIISGKACIAEEDYPALAGAISIMDPPGADSDNIVWWPIYRIVHVSNEQSTVQEPPEIEGNANIQPEAGETPEGSAPEAGRPMTGSAPEAPSSTYEAPQIPALLSPVDSPDSALQNPAETERIAPAKQSEILSIQCRESEAEAKIAELKAQGYEIVRVEKLPKWWR